MFKVGQIIEHVDGEFQVVDIIQGGCYAMRIPKFGAAAYVAFFPNPPAPKAIPGRRYQRQGAQIENLIQGIGLENGKIYVSHWQDTASGVREVAAWVEDFHSKWGEVG